MSKYVYFHVAGKVKDRENLFLTTESRHNSLHDAMRVFHRNDYHTVLRIEYPAFKEHFAFDRHAGIYRNNLTYGQARSIPGIQIKTFDIVSQIGAFLFIDEC